MPFVPKKNQPSKPAAPAPSDGRVAARVPREKKPDTVWVVVNPDRLLTIPNSTTAGPGFVNYRKTEADGAFEVPNDPFIRRRLIRQDIRQATDEEIAVARAAGVEALPAATSPGPDPLAPPRAAAAAPVQAVALPPPGAAPELGGGETA